ncbi:MAG: CapA family protein [Bacteroidota bacterium]
MRFRFVADSLRKADLVFVNLESPLTDQGGVTEHPKVNLIFCGPPAGAWSLRQAGIDVVSTANNHAFDFGIRALRETIANLELTGIAWTGTSVDSVSLFAPAVVAVRGVRIAFVAFTEFVNLKGRWSEHIALFDSLSAEAALRAARARADIVVASYHGGGEYGDRPSRRSLAHLRWLAQAGADVVLGHHPHVPQGIERVGETWIVHSLGNFVFAQPQRYWTQIGLAARITVRRTAGRPRISALSLIPLQAGLQPRWDVSPSAKDSLVARLEKGSSLQFRRSQGIIHVSSDSAP